MECKISSFFKVYWPIIINYKIWKQKNTEIKFYKDELYWINQIMWAHRVYKIEFLNYIIVLCHIMTCSKNFMAPLFYCLYLYSILKWDKIAVYYSKSSKFIVIVKIIATRDNLSWKKCVEERYPKRDQKTIPLKTLSTSI